MIINRKHPDCATNLKSREYGLRLHTLLIKVVWSLSLAR
jgi:hypothetical protein